jgi:SAM-dependent methyltransferase
LRRRSASYSYARIWRTGEHFIHEEDPELVTQAIEWCAERIGKAPDRDGILPNFLPGIGSGDFAVVGSAQVRRMVDLAGLRPGDRVGCGLGRTARALRHFLSASGRYDGIDVVCDVVRCCQQNLSRVDRRLRFHHAPVRNELYQPQGGIEAREYRFPFDDASFDVVIAESLFTHLDSEAVRHYLAEIGRVPASGRRALRFRVPARSRRAPSDRGRSKRSPLRHGARRGMD